MKRMIIAAAALLCACTPTPAAKSEAPPASAPLADAAGNRLEALTDSAGRWCTGDGVWCVAAVDEVNVNVTRGEQAAAGFAVDAAPDGGSWAIWPHIVRVGRNDESVFVGVTRTANQMYSGGGGSATTLTLYGISSGAPADVLSAPLSGDVTIRACFGEEDMEARHGACHDEYAFAGALTLDETVAEGAPRFILTTEATTFPGRVSRNQDSTTAPPLQQSDLVRWRDDVCSYRRVATRQGGAYVWNEPLPPCSDYLEP